MTRIDRSALVEVPVSVAYEVVADVERYPEFLPGCANVTVDERLTDGLVAEVTVKAKGFAESFVTRNEHGPDTIRMTLVTGPFRSLEGVWRFRAIGADGCRVEMRLEYEISGVLGALLKSVADAAANVLVDAFVARMQAAHG